MKYTLFFLLILSFAFCNSQVYPFPQNVKYPYGLQSNKLTDNHAFKAYEKWKNTFVVYCNGDEARVKNDRNETVSEGIGYGMCIVAYAGDKILFDQLLNYYNKRLNAFGMMNWLYKDCETGNNQKNGATDADIDIAFALVVASKQWRKDEKYLSLANDLIDRLQQYNFTECDGLIVQKPGDAFGG